MTKPHITIIVLNWNGKKDTLGCLASLQQLDYPNFQTLVVDNGSTDDSVAVIREQFPHIELLETGQNLGFAEGNNVGVRHALQKNPDYFLLLNNDTVVDPQLLNAFVSSMREEIGILGAKIYLYDKKDTLDHLGGMWNAKKAVFDLTGLRQIDDGKSWEEMRPLDYVCGCALFVKRAVFEQVGLLEPKFFLIWEESDFCFRARRAGYETMTCPGAKLWHKVSASFVGGKPHSTYFWWRNRLLWIERNCPPKEKVALYLKVLLPKILMLYKLRLLKTCQLALLRRLRPHQDHLQRQQKLQNYRAALQGISDYFRRRFGNGPAWIYKK
jgi:GT2 family glycosyltransferase